MQCCGWKIWNKSNCFCNTSIACSRPVADVGIQYTNPKSARRVRPEVESFIAD